MPTGPENQYSAWATGLKFELKPTGFYFEFEGAMIDNPRGNVWIAEAVEMPHRQILICADGFKTLEELLEMNWEQP